MEEYNELFEVPQSCIRIGPKRYLVTKKYVRMASDIYNLELRPDDITVASYQRSGTTLTQELVWLIVHDLDFERAAAVPLSQRYQFLEFAMFFDETVHNRVLDNCPEGTKALMEIIQTPAAKILPDVPSPRFIKTHLPMSLLPPKLVDKTKVVYVARDPRDVAILYL